MLHRQDALETRFEKFQVNKFLFMPGVLALKQPLLGNSYAKAEKKQQRS